MTDVTAIGEILIDFTPTKASDGSDAFAKKPGGAPANVACAVSKLGGKTAFIGKVGKDAFGDFLIKTLDDNKVSTKGLVSTDEVHTTLAFVELDEHGDRSFSFYRNPGADILLTADEIDKSLLSETHFLHFGSVSLTNEPSRSATLFAAKTAKENGAVISYDPNFRTPLWKSEEEAVEVMKKAVPLADIIKVSEEELLMLTGESDLLSGAKALQSEGVSLVLVTCGAKGAFYLCGEASELLPTYNVVTIDTNGAGDTFFGAVLFSLKDKSKEEIASLSKAELHAIVSFANAAGSLATTKSGAIPAMPTKKEVEDCLKSVPLLKIKA